MQNFDNAHINEEKSKLDKIDNKLDDLESRLSHLGSVLKISIYLIMAMVFYICVKLSLDNKNVGQSLESENISIQRSEDGKTVTIYVWVEMYKFSLSKEQVEKFGGEENLKNFLDENLKEFLEKGKISIPRDKGEILGVENMKKIFRRPSQWKNNKSN